MFCCQWRSLGKIVHAEKLRENEIAVLNPEEHQKTEIFLKETESNQKPETEVLTYRNQQSFVRTEEVMLKKIVGQEQEFTQKHYVANMFDLAMLQKGINWVEYPILGTGVEIGYKSRKNCLTNNVNLAEMHFFVTHIYR